MTMNFFLFYFLYLVLNVFNFAKKNLFEFLFYFVLPLRQEDQEKKVVIPAEMAESALEAERQCGLYSRNVHCLNILLWS